MERFAAAVHPHKKQIILIIDIELWFKSVSLKIDTITK